MRLSPISPSHKQSIAKWAISCDDNCFSHLKSCLIKGELGFAVVVFVVSVLVDIIDSSRLDKLLAEVRFRNHNDVSPFVSRLGLSELVMWLRLR